MTTSDSTTNDIAIAYAIGSTGSLTVRVASWDIDLVGTAGDEVRVRNADGGPLPSDIEVERETGSLRIGQPSRLGFGLVFGFGRSRVRLAIEVPSRARVDVQSASGGISARTLRLDQRYRTASGDIEVLDAGGELTAETVSGDVSVRIDGSLGLTVRSVSGDVSVEGGMLDRIALTTTSGDLRIASELGSGPHSISTLSGDALIAPGRGVRVVAKTISGDVSSDLPHSSEGGPGSRTVVIGDGSTEVQFKSVSGDLRVVGRVSGREFSGQLPGPPTPPRPPVAPNPPAPLRRPGDAATTPEADPTAGDDAEAARLAILQALEHGEIDVAEAADRLAQLDGPADD
jgi:hypothetical protein